MKEKLKTMWSITTDNHLFVYWRGKLIYKRWVDRNGRKTQSSVLFNEKWPNEEIT